MTERAVPRIEHPDRAQALWLTLLLLAAYLPLASHLAWQISVFAALVFALRILAIRWPALVPGRRGLAALTLIGIVNAVSTYQGWSGQSAGAALFVSMLVLKLMELRRREDLRLVTTLIGFLAVVQFLFDQSPWLVVYLGTLVFAGLALLVDLNGRVGEARRRSVLGVAARLSAQAAPLTLVLFLLFPRLSAPLWHPGTDPHQAATGMSETLEPGAISELVLNGEPAFRVRFETPPPATDRLYWRGPVLWHTDGRRWSAGGEASAAGPPGELRKANGAVLYELTLEPTDQRWLFALDLPVTVPEGAFLTSDHRLLAHRPVSATRRYRMVSALDYLTAPPDRAGRDAGLQIPDNVTERMRRLAAGWRGEAGTDWGVVELGLGFFNREPFHYTLLPPRLGANPSDEFLFETRRGFCEHYASSFAILMRLAGVPSRVVLGYLGAEANPVGGYHLVRQSDAHAWVEVLIEGRGWVRVDPTAAVDPSRVDNSSASRLLGSGASVRFTLAQSDAIARLARGLRLLGDSLEAAWQDWVLGFSVDDQFSLLKWLRLEGSREYGLAALLLVAFGLTLGLVFLGSVRERPRADPLEAAYARLCRRLARAGLGRRPNEGPLAYGSRVMAQRPDLAPTVERFLRLYIPARYGHGNCPHAHLALADLLRGFRPRGRTRTQGEVAGT